jgi:hypothetical protein
VVVSFEHRFIKYDKLLDEQSDCQLLCSTELVTEGKAKGNKSGTLSDVMINKIALLIEAGVMSKKWTLKSAHIRLIMF